MKKQLLVTLSILLVTSGMWAQQDATLNFRPFANMYSNPADLINKRAWHATVYYRNSLVGFERGPESYYFGMGGPIGLDKATSNVTRRHAYTRRKEARYGLGGYIIRDTHGHTGYQSYMLNYAQRFNITRDHSFSIGVGAGLFHYFILSEQLRVKEDNDPTLHKYIRENDNFRMGDVNLGVIVSSPSVQLGVACRHLISNSVKLGDTPEYANLQETWLGFVRTRFFVKDNVEMVPSIDVTYTQGIPFDLKVNAPVVFYRMFMAGMALSWQKSFSVETGIYGGGWFFGYAFTLNTSQLVTFSDLTHQVAIRYVLPFTRNAQDNFSATDALF